MNFAAFGLFLICCYIEAIETNGYAINSATKFEEFLERFKAVIKTGNDTFGIPPLDPFNADKLPIQFHEESIDLDALLTHVDVQGLSAYDVNAGDFKILPPSASLNLTWPLVIANTDYEMDGKLEGFELSGQGYIKMAARGFNAVVSVSFGLQGTGIIVKSVTTSFSLEKLALRITGLFNDEQLSELLSAILSDMMPGLIKDYQEPITEKANAIITNLLNHFLEGKTLQEILDILGL